MIRLLIFCYNFQACFNEEKMVSPYHQTSYLQQKLDFILSELEEIISGMARQKDNVKLKSLDFHSCQEEVRCSGSARYSILKIAYPTSARPKTEKTEQAAGVFPLRSQASIQPSPEAQWDTRTRPCHRQFHHTNKWTKSVVKVNVWKVTQLRL